jgi:hypothetical protein
VCRGVSWCVVVCRGVSWCVVVCRVVSWCVVVCRGLSWLSLSFVGLIVECCYPTTVPLLTFNCTVLFCASGTDMSGLVSRLGIAAGLGESKPTDRYVLCF